MKTSKPRVTGLCEGKSPVIGEFPAQRISNAENVYIWRHHHECNKTENGETNKQVRCMSLFALHCEYHPMFAQINQGLSQ